MRAKRRYLLLCAVALPLWIAAQQLEVFTVTLQNRDVRSIIARVSGELGPQGQVQLDTASNRLTVRDEPSRLARLRAIVAELDRPARRFALTTTLEVLARPAKGLLFRSSPTFVDMTRWAQDLEVLNSYECIVDIQEGEYKFCTLGKEYRFEALAEGYDPTKRRLGLKKLALSRFQEGQPDVTLLRGLAVLPEGDPTVFLVSPSEKTEPLRLKITPVLLPSVHPREAR